MVKKNGLGQVLISNAGIGHHSQRGVVRWCMGAGRLSWHTFRGIARAISRGRQRGD
ncbi:hypothetical protein KCP78_20595 [Salmonella enterica subsp. enterica]|nr:hypothetical protein KCP78_20595 [Salmonella enterica subsp. enterica]